MALSKSFFFTCTYTFFFCCTSFVVADVPASKALPPKGPLDLPWLTGPLIAPAGTVISKGQMDIESYLFVTTNTGIYDEHWHAQSQPNFCTINPLLLSYFGITEWMDFQFDPQIIYNISQGESSVHFGDLILGFDFQVFPADKSKWFPGIKIAVTESLPIGKYQKLNPKKLNTDSSGSGSFETHLQLVFYKAYHIKNLHYLSMTFAFEYEISAPVHVKGFNTYGGGHGTRGKAYPGNELNIILSFEYSLTQHWVLALDNVYTHQDKTRFRGNSGIIAGTPASVGGPSSEQLSFAPAIEYNFNSAWGIIAGAWVTAIGRNSAEFRSGVIALNYSH